MQTVVPSQRPSAGGVGSAQKWRQPFGKQKQWSVES